MEPKIGIVWFRNDLRLHDNESLTEAIKKCDFVVPVYVFDERLFYGKTSFGFEKIGNFRTKFIIESVDDLRKNLQSKGSDLIIRTGNPEKVIFEIAKEIKSSWVFCNRERTTEEVKVQDSLEAKLWGIGQELKFYRGKMLYNTADLPFPVSQTPDTFTQYRKEVENIIEVRSPLQTPKAIPFPQISIERGNLPELSQFGKAEIEDKHIENHKFTGGESKALEQLNYFIWGNKLISNYKNTRNEMLGWNYSSKFSPWLALGCLSPKMIMAEIKKYEDTITRNESTYWLYFELLWRDFFRLMGKKFGKKIFLRSGTRDVNISASEDKVLFNQWAEGKTGVPIIDANMRQLNQTGFMSNRGRQNVAGFLIKDLKLNWLMGAEYFESLLIDYDPCSNYGNWNYLAGVGSDPREDRYFQVVLQSKRYDPNGEFIRYWLPELKNLPANLIHFPDQMNINQQIAYSVILGKDYPEAISKSLKWA